MQGFFFNLDPQKQNDIVKKDFLHDDKGFYMKLFIFSLVLCCFVYLPAFAFKIFLKNDMDEDLSRKEALSIKMGMVRDKVLASYKRLDFSEDFLRRKGQWLLSIPDFDSQIQGGEFSLVTKMGISCQKLEASSVQDISIRISNEGVYACLGLEDASEAVSFSLEGEGPIYQVRRPL